MRHSTIGHPIQLRFSMGTAASGSCPNIGTGEHTYIFTLYALSEQLDLTYLSVEPWEKGQRYSKCVAGSNPARPTIFPLLYQLLSALSRSASGASARPVPDFPSHTLCAASISQSDCRLQTSPARPPVFTLNRQIVPR